MVAELSVGAAVAVRTADGGTEPGVIVDDFGDQGDGVEVSVGDGEMARPRRWAVALDRGGLVFVDDDGLVGEDRDGDPAVDGTEHAGDSVVDNSAVDNSAIEDSAADSRDAGESGATDDVDPAADPA